MKKLFILCLLLATPIWAAEFQAGIARTIVTPPVPFWLTGYAARTNAAASVQSDLYAKALAVQDEQGGRVVILTTDLIGLPREVSSVVAERVEQRHGLTRAQLLLNSSHTHSGPVIWPNLSVMFGFDAEQKARALEYREKLTDNLVTLVGAALKNLAPARLSFVRSSASFAINRRFPTTNGFRISPNPAGPVDHTVPVLKVTTPDGHLRAVLFGYACHNTTLGGDFYQIDGDYAGCAQRTLEAAHPGTTAMFMMLCGGDQNPNPRGTYEQVEQHGHELAQAVERVLAEPGQALRPPIRAAYRTTQLDFAPHTREAFEEEAQSKNKYHQRRARLMLEAYDRAQPIRQLAYPVQAVRFNDDLTFLALGGEVVMDYSHRAQREFPQENLVVAGYCNEVACYIPSRRVLDEGGYEPVDSMIYYAQPGPFAENVEEMVFRTVRQTLAEVGVK